MASFWVKLKGNYIIFLKCCCKFITIIATGNYILFITINMIAMHKVKINIAL